MDYRRLPLSMFNLLHDVNCMYMYTIRRLNDLWYLFQIHISRKWGFTKWDRDVYEPMRADGRLVPDGVNVQYRPHHGPLAKWMAAQG